MTNNIPWPTETVGVIRGFEYGVASKNGIDLLWFVPMITVFQSSPPIPKGEAVVLANKGACGRDNVDLTVVLKKFRPEIRFTVALLPMKKIGVINEVIYK